VYFGIDTFHPPTPAAERYFQAARSLGVVPDGGPAEIVVSPKEAIRAATLTTGRRYVALCPGAAHGNKRWPPAHWRVLARRLMDQGESVVGIGTAEDAGLLDQPGVISGFGADLPLAAALLAGAVAAVANDSGLMHLAAAVGTPVVALFGPTSPVFGYAPYRARAAVLERSLPCRPCTAFGGPHCPMRHHRCMIDLDPGQVLTALRSLA
jgi:heptosyltransferase-2